MDGRCLTRLTWRVLRKLPTPDFKVGPGPDGQEQTKMTPTRGLTPGFRARERTDPAVNGLFPYMQPPETWIRIDLALWKDPRSGLTPYDCPPRPAA